MYNALHGHNVKIFSGKNYHDIECDIKEFINKIQIYVYYQQVQLWTIIMFLNFIQLLFFTTHQKMIDIINHCGNISLVGNLR